MFVKIVKCFDDEVDENIFNFVTKCFDIKVIVENFNEKIINTIVVNFNKSVIVIKVNCLI